MIPRIKICGLRDPETALAAARLGADAIGLVFYAPSPRAVNIETARRIAQCLPPFVAAVGLFVDADPAYVREVLASVPLDILQFHGEESPEYCRQFSRPYLKAVRVKPALDLLEYAARYADARGILVDTYVPQAPGGTGETFDWSLLPQHFPLPLVLSGGLHPGNVSEAIRRVQPWAVDISSGVESSRGIKDVAKIAAFNEAVRRSGSPD